MLNSLNEHHFSSLDIAITSLVDEITSSIHDAIAKRGRAIIAVSGGRTPINVFKQLRSKKIDWSRLTITLTDERWVSNVSDESNEKLVHTFLRNGEAEAASFIPLYGGEATPVAGQAACEERLRKLKFPFDAVYLGMGEDGHFASLFPGTGALEENKNLCVAVPESQTRSARMSLSKATLFNARKVFLLFAGQAKKEIFDIAKVNGSYHTVPLRLLVSQKKAPVTVFMAP